MRLILVRHGETAANAEGRIQGQLRGRFPLSAEGRLQAEKLREELAAEGLEPTHVYASPLERAYETAKILARGWGTDVKILDDLMEHGLGVVSGMTIEEAAEKFPHIDTTHPRLWEVEGAESINDRWSRAEEACKALMEHADSDLVVAVSHGGIMQNIIAVLLGTRCTLTIGIRNTGVFDLTLNPERWSKGSVRVVERTGVEIIRFNDASHLRTQNSLGIHHDSL